ncbi:YqaE/Pmp3 family membrane protein [Chitinophagaceae bacterium LB-8]|uniref:YqaE/Pmp3 family membrane protein n=1 Tax=Paraflavisolibacter caeni TaxID=2982496 RepID=A0A9X3B7M4_9BACT|nr:YqaE/Pmp3 family membrane protein [Paraflavisolibacter caeni]MCU7549455.1 YqaE/Pmp3 family membrane protein [Paraflavisolibacter caeni]
MKNVIFRILLVLLSFASIAPQTFAASMPVLVKPNTEDPTVKQALEEFNNLPSKEKKERIKEAKKAIKKLKAEKKAGIELTTSKALEIIFAILLPPLGIYLHEGRINNRFWIGLLLTLLFFIPGMVYALIIVLTE